MGYGRGVQRTHFFLLRVGLECNAADNLSLRSNQDPESLSLPGRRYCLSVPIDVPVLNGVSEEDITRNITIDEADAGAVEWG